MKGSSVTTSPLSQLSQEGKEGVGHVLGVRRGGVLAGLSEGCCLAVPEPRPQSLAGEEVNPGGR